jgi:hypothetical protein
VRSTLIQKPIDNARIKESRTAVVAPETKKYIEIQGLYRKEEDDEQF